MGSKILSITDSTMGEAFAELSKADTEFAVNTLKSTFSDTSRYELKETALQKRLSSREEINNEHARRLAIKREAWQRAEERWRISEGKLMDIQSEIRRVRRETNSLQRSTAEHEMRLTQLNRLFSNEDTVRQRATMVHMLKDVIDTSVPVQYNIESQPGTGNYKQTLEWTTKVFHLDIRQTDHEGRGAGIPHKSLTGFGPFSIKVRRIYNGDSAYLEADANFDHHAVIRSGYAHPHVSAEGAICLGSARAELLDLMKLGDYAGVINVIMGVLCSYNPNDPYHHLQNWEPNRHTSIGCPSCTKVLMACDCPTSVVSGNAVEDKYLNDCGATFDECLLHHERHETSMGINGSPCVPTRRSQRYSRTNIQEINTINMALDQMINERFNETLQRRFGEE